MGGVLKTLLFFTVLMITLHISLHIFNYKVPCFRFDSEGGDLGGVLKKLLFFTILMITMPISLYFITKSVVFEGK